MPSWRCPHCGTPQTETSRCWVCKRSSTSCATCRNFRRSIAGQLGYCGLDRHRLPLRGDELRGCWTAPLPTPDPALVARAVRTRATPDPDDARPRLDFVPVGAAPAARPVRRRARRGGAVVAAALPAAEARGTLWDEEA